MLAGTSGTFRLPGRVRIMLAHGIVRRSRLGGGGTGQPVLAPGTTWRFVSDPTAGRHCWGRDADGANAAPVIVDNRACEPLGPATFTVARRERACWCPMRRVRRLVTPPNRWRELSRVGTADHEVHRVHPWCVTRQSSARGYVRVADCSHAAAAGSGDGRGRAETVKWKSGARP